MQTIKLLQVIPALDSGGVEQGTVDIAQGVVKKSGSSLVVSNGGRLVPRLKRCGSEHIELSVHSKNPWVIFRNIKKLREIIDTHNINIIHTRSRAPAWSSYFAARGRIKIVSTFHNVYGYGSSSKRYYNSGLARADAIIAISNFVKNKIIELYNIPRKKVKVIYRGIDEKYFINDDITESTLLNFIKENQIFTDKKIILYPARLTPWKGQIEFLEILKKLDSNDYFCIFVGDEKNQKYSEKLKKKIVDLKLNSSCKVMGHISDMKCMYKISHLVVSASQKPEGFGRVVAEAMAMEKPVVAYDHGGVSEQMQTYDKSFRIPFMDQAGMVNAINIALSMSKEAMNQIVLSPKEFVNKNFTRKEMVENTYQLYKNLLKK
ncbi:MAG: N-acetyl-alpha-D-glucosaminyl L-malate synthase [Alphaproteobacteria bacterium MarineAlpha5_Bin11]|nr:glycosyl transferase [Pelagibacteraceae bacterium]PPR44736.1 MAG: N-acetyl-alpha-D-glucosaminyl L-malate synthase [Alphaproteobacteria bacterium MarineAlpha5_Bin11]PPR52174.1 MAG: N-acetyl-alpha-D-glucosaminyl L-malate synthase [Alphaproteobacteria bacterium MarineAlpha5_Bin10]|tara:strand:+ start:18125 stop:19252 length:1128 start_codon:yes stop_codon:yes gene_type:complete